MSQELDKVAAEDGMDVHSVADEDLEQELILDEQKRAWEQQQLEPPGVESPAFWSMMGAMLDTMLDTKMPVLGSQFATALNVVESRLSDKIGTESAMRAEENRNMRSELEKIAASVDKLEKLEHSGTTEFSAAAPKRQDGWQQNCIILGGWLESWTGPLRVAYVETIMRRANLDKDMHLAPFAPPRSSIVKIRCDTTHVAGDMLFRIMRELAKSNGADEATKKVWAAPERPSEEGHRRRVLRTAAEDIKAMLEPGATASPVVHWAAGEISLQDRVLLRAVGGRLCAAEGWGTSPPTRGGEWAPRALTIS